MVDTQAIYQAAVRRMDEQDTINRLFKAREKQVEIVMKLLFTHLQLQAIQDEIMIKRMMFDVG